MPEIPKFNDYTTPIRFNHNVNAAHFATIMFEEFGHELIDRYEFFFLAMDELYEQFNDHKDRTIAVGGPFIETKSEDGNEEDGK